MATLQTALRVCIAGFALTLACSGSAKPSTTPDPILENASKNLEKDWEYEERMGFEAGKPWMDHTKEMTTKISTLLQQGGEHLLRGEFDRAFKKYSEALSLSPNDPLVIDRYAAGLFYRAQGGKIESDGTFTPNPNPESPQELLRACPLLKASSDNGGEMAKSILSSSWRDCATYGARLYLSTDGIIRIRNTGGDEPGTVTFGSKSTYLEELEERRKCAAAGKCQPLVWSEETKAYYACIDKVRKIYRLESNAKLVYQAERASCGGPPINVYK